MKRKITYDIAIIIISILANIVMGHLVIILKIPFLFMDSAGTILTAVLLGPIYSAVVGIATNFIISMTIDYVNLHFAVVNVFIGLTAGVIARKHDFSKMKVSIISGIIIGIISAIVAAPIAIIAAKGVTNKPIDNFVQLIYNSGKSLIISITMSTVLSSMIDKILSSIIVTMAIKSIPFLSKENNHHYK
ncbi:ECF transporter S component [Brachyspira hyodysenteriae]|uniref:ECF transporter S component n=1 Tax=Brachyspira hyodysenteriae TaxID=159 RepID=UPI0022CD55D7|nr:ECF transporter S component [Brachyspira hyodysenteriae]MCZ9957014.1 ECF transporter S component [Brachyspira hyodysenteriae]MDA0081534.1 ECF transporter S component [Brachyspira hyodysenteriae]